MQNDELDFVEDFDISKLEVSTFPISRILVQKSGVIARIGPTTFTIYCILRSFVNSQTGLAWPGNETLGAIIKRKHDTVGRAVEELCTERLAYVDTPPGGPKTRGIRLIDWYPGHVFTPGGDGAGPGIVKGRIAVPYIPGRYRALLELARNAAAASLPEVVVRQYALDNGLNADSFHFMRYTLDGEWVFALAPWRISRSFFMAAGVEFESVTQFYARISSIDKQEAEKRRAAAIAQSDTDDF